MSLKLTTIFASMAIVCLFVGHAGAEVILAKDIYPGVNSSNPSELTNVNGTLFFAADNRINGVELWKARGTGGTTPLLVKNIYLDNPPVINSSNPTELTDVNGTLFFAADDGTNGEELWRSNGAAAGTVLVQDINPTGSSSPRELTNANGVLFFTADDGIVGRELYRHDPIAVTTDLVQDPINPITISDPAELTSVGNALFFAASNGVDGVELWRIDHSGSLIPTLVEDINSGGGDSSPGELINVGGILFFVANDGAVGRELWRHDPVAGTTVLVEDINPGVGDSFPIGLPSELINVGGILFFAANDGTNGRELWRHDPVAGTTVLVKDIRPGANNSSNPGGLTNVNGTLFFAADDDGTHGRELWKSDGTELGTVEVEDIWVGIDSSAPMELTAGSLYFTADDGAMGRELWRHDPIAGTTELVKDIRPGANPPGSDPPSELTNVNGVLFFKADDGTHGIELWRSSAAEGAVVAGGDGCFIETAAFDVPHKICAWILDALWDK